MSTPSTFVDSNVIIYAYDSEAGAKRDRALDRLTGLWDSGRGVLSTQVLQESYVNLTRKVRAPISVVQAREIIVTYRAWPTHLPDADSILEASDVAERHRIAFWDALIVVSARAMGAQVLLTEDLSHGQVIEGVRVVNPFLEDDPAGVSG